MSEGPLQRRTVVVNGIETTMSLNDADAKFHDEREAALEESRKIKEATATQALRDVKDGVPVDTDGADVSEKSETKTRAPQNKARASADNK